MNVISIKDFYDLYDGEPCIVQGEIFSIEGMVLKSGKTLKTIRITDGESSLTSKIFLDENDNLDISEGKILKLSGKVQMDTYAGNEKTLMIKYSKYHWKEVIKKEDTAEEKNGWATYTYKNEWNGRSNWCWRPYKKSQRIWT